MADTFKISKIASAPKAFLGFANRINKLIKAVDVISKMRGDGNINVAVSDDNILFSLGQIGEGRDTDSRFRAVPATLSIAGIVPTANEIKTSIESAYSSADVDPALGDLVYMDQFHYLIVGRRDITNANISANDIFRVIFTVDSTNFVALQIGPNRLL